MTFSIERLWRRWLYSIPPLPSFIMAALRHCISGSGERPVCELAWPHGPALVFVLAADGFITLGHNGILSFQVHCGPTKLVVRSVGK